MAFHVAPAFARFAKLREPTEYARMAAYASNALKSTLWVRVEEMMAVPAMLERRPSWRSWVPGTRRVKDALKPELNPTFALMTPESMMTPSPVCGSASAPVDSASNDKSFWLEIGDLDRFIYLSSIPLW